MSDTRFQSLEDLTSTKTRSPLKSAPKPDSIRGQTRLPSKLKSDTIKVLAEILSTGLLVLFGCMGCIPENVTSPPSLFKISLLFGISVMFILQIFAHVSGAHMNPCVTVAAAIWGIVSPVLAIAYVTAQVLGAILGFGLLRLLTPSELMYPSRGNNSIASICTTVPSRELADWQVGAVEILVTSVLILVICSVWDPANKFNTDSVPTKIGLLVFALIFLAGPLSGASMNPARSFGPALWNSDWERHWIYWVFPLGSSAASTYLYRYLFLTKTDTAEKMGCSAI